MIVKNVCLDVSYVDPINNLRQTLETLVIPSMVLCSKYHVVVALIHTYTHPSLTHPKGP